MELLHEGLQPSIAAQMWSHVIPFWRSTSQKCLLHHRIESVVWFEGSFESKFCCIFRLLVRGKKVWSSFRRYDLPHQGSGWSLMPKLDTMEQPPLLLMSLSFIYKSAWMCVPSFYIRRALKWNKINHFIGSSFHFRAFSLSCAPITNWGEKCLKQQNVGNKGEKRFHSPYPCVTFHIKVKLLFHFISEVQRHNSTKETQFNKFLHPVWFDSELSAPQVKWFNIFMTGTRMNFILKCYKKAFFLW